MSCGCEVGSVFALGALVGTVGHLMFRTGNSVGWGSVAWVGVWVVSLAALGKLIGLGYARIRLFQLHVQLDRARGQIFGDVATSAEPGSVRAIQPSGLPAGPSKE